MLNSDSQSSLLVREIYLYLKSEGSLPNVQQFRISHESDRQLLDELTNQDLLRNDSGRYLLTRKGLSRVGGEEAREEFEAFNKLIPVVKDCYRTDPEKHWQATEIADRAGRTAEEIRRTLTFFQDVIPWSSAGGYGQTGLRDSLKLTEKVLDLRPIQWTDVESVGDRFELGPFIWRLRKLRIDGYRLFRNFEASLGDLTVIIGANATGKSSLFDLVRFLSFAAENPLPPEVDPFSSGKRVFHADGPLRIAVELTADLGGDPGVKYELEIEGPAPKVRREELWSLGPPQGLSDKWPFLEFKNGKGEIRDPGHSGLAPEKWTIKPNELALRSSIHPSMTYTSAFRTFLSSWRVYSARDIAPATKVGQPVLTQPEPSLERDGSNLNAVLLSLITEHREAFANLETHLRSVVPGFESLSTKPAGGRGTVMARWRERGLTNPITLADLSDGTLLFLCWAVLCLSPNLPPLLCIDEPELGMHPRALPVVAGLIREASARTQIIVATHSPYLLSQFDLEEIAVMRREGDSVVFARPSDNSSLQRELKEIGGDALVRMHLSDELESRS